MASCNVDNNMLSKQQEMTNQINQLLAQSSQSLLCGPGTECERTQKTEDLQQKYLAAQTNIQSAPYQEEQAEKAYYTYTQGDAAYNAMKAKRLQETAEKKANEIQVSFNENSAKAIELNDTLSSLTKNYQHVTELYQTYVEENAILGQKIQSYRTDVVTSDRKTYYENQNYDILLLVNNEPTCFDKNMIVLHISDKVVTVLRKPEFQNRIQSILDPIVNHVINRVFPYILLSSILFLILILVTVSTFIIVVRSSLIAIQNADRTMKTGLADNW
jgi:hypothetical protein